VSCVDFEENVGSARGKWKMTFIEVSTPSKTSAQFFWPKIAISSRHAHRRLGTGNGAQKYARRAIGVVIRVRSFRLWLNQLMVFRR